MIVLVLLHWSQLSEWSRIQFRNYRGSTEPVNSPLSRTITKEWRAYVNNL